MAEREAIRPAGAGPSAVPLTPGIKAGGFVFVSGQTGRAVVDGQAVVGQGVTEQTRYCLENIKAVLGAAGSGMEKVVKTTVYVTDLGGYAMLNEVWVEVFGDHRPTRSAVEVAALPVGACVEVELWAAPAS